MCETYGVELRDEDIREVLEIADEHGEVIELCVSILGLTMVILFRLGRMTLFFT